MPSEADQVIGLYERYAREWDSDRGRSLWEKPWLDRFLGLLSPRASILDLGCGSAEPIAAYFIDKGHAVTGADSSPALIGICKDRFPNQNWTVADMRTLSLDRRFPGILAWDSVFHLCPEDQRRMFPIFSSHAEAPGALMFTSGTAYGASIGAYRGEPLYHGSLDESEYRSLLNQNGFEVLSHVIEDPTCRHHTVWLAQLR